MGALLEAGTPLRANQNAAYGKKKKEGTQLPMKPDQDPQEFTVVSLTKSQLGCLAAGTTALPGGGLFVRLWRGRL